MSGGEEKQGYILEEAVQVDSHHYLLGRERPPPQDANELFGRHAGDSEKLFPRYTHAAAATTGEVEVNGKVLRMWTFAQLDALNQKVLKERALAIRDAVGEANCPPIPSIQSQDLIRWILHMQAKMTGGEREPPVGRAGGGGGYGAGGGHYVPASFAKDTKDRPIAEARAPGTRLFHAPFGPRNFHWQEESDGPAKDYYVDLKYQRNKFKEAPNLGIETGRPGGEGKRHLPTGNNMLGFGVSTSDAQSHEGRRYLGCDDHVMEQKHGVEVPEPISPRAGVPMSPRNKPEPVRHVSESHMECQGVAAPLSQHQVTGDRRRHIACADRLVNHGTSEPGEEASSGRKYLDSFAGSRTHFSDSNGGYQSTWKKDPARLRGTSLLV